jgi:hypothetical protein
MSLIPAFVRNYCSRSAARWPNRRWSCRNLPAVDVSIVTSGIFFCKARTCLSPAVNTPAAFVSGIIPLNTLALYVKKSVCAIKGSIVTAVKLRLYKVTAKLTKGV